MSDNLSSFKLVYNFVNAKMSEVLASLRKLDFPKFVSVAITQADYCLSSKEVGGIPGLMTSHELAEEISSEFIFCLKGNKVKAMKI